MTAQVNPLAVMGELISITYPERSAEHEAWNKRAKQARAAVAELVAAVIENREATQAFANDGHPFNYARWDASERRITDALAPFREVQV